MGDESYYTVSAMNMLKRGEPFTPYYFDHYRLNKPILTYWIVMASYAVLGVSMWSGRVPFLIVAVLTIVYTYRLGLLLLKDKNKALLSAVILSSTYNFVSFSRIAMTDPLLMVFCLLSLLLYAKVLLSPARSLALAAGGSICTGLAILTKGPIGLFPWLVCTVSVFLLPKTDRTPSLRALMHPLNAAIVAALVVPWYLYLYKSYPEVLTAALKTETRHLGHGFQLVAFGRRLVFYPSCLVVMTLPFSVAGLYLVLKKGIVATPSKRLLTLYVVGTTVFFILFSDASKERYLLIVFPQVTILLADILYGRKWKVWLTIAMSVFLIQALAFGCYPIVVGEPIRKLVDVWKKEHSGTIGFVFPDRKPVGWGRLFAHDEHVADEDTAEFLILPEEELPRYQRWKICARAFQRTGVRFEKGRWVIKGRSYVLVQRPKSQEVDSFLFAPAHDSVDPVGPILSVPTYQGVRQYLPVASREFGPIASSMGYL